MAFLIVGTEGGAAKFVCWEPEQDAVDITPTVTAGLTPICAHWEPNSGQTNEGTIIVGGGQSTVEGSGAAAFWRSTDGGSTWTEITYTGSLIRDVTYHAATQRWVAISTGLHWWSDDDGASWSNHNSNISGSWLAVVDAQIVWAFGASSTAGYSPVNHTSNPELTGSTSWGAAGDSGHSEFNLESGTAYGNNVVAVSEAIGGSVYSYPDGLSPFSPQPVRTQHAINIGFGFSPTIRSNNTAEVALLIVAGPGGAGSGPNMAYSTGALDTWVDMSIGGVDFGTIFYPTFEDVVWDETVGWVAVGTFAGGAVVTYGGSTVGNIDTLESNVVHGWSESGSELEFFSPRAVCGGLTTCTGTADECDPPRALAVPHPSWAYGDRPDWFTDNWLAVERWCAEVDSKPKCQLHIPRKHDPTPEGAMANYNAVRRWVDSDCLCCATAAKHELPVPSARWTHQDYMQRLVRWVDYVRLNCGS